MPEPDYCVVFSMVCQEESSTNIAFIQVNISHDYVHAMVNS